MNAVLENGSETRLGTGRAGGAQCSGRLVQCRGVNQIAASQQQGGGELRQRYDDSVKSSRRGMEPGASHCIRSSGRSSVIQACGVRAGRPNGLTSPRFIIHLLIRLFGFNFDSPFPLPLSAPGSYTLYLIQITSNLYSQFNCPLHYPIPLPATEYVGHSPPIDSCSAGCSASSSCEACHGHGQHPVRPRQGHSSRPFL